MQWHPVSSSSRTPGSSADLAQAATEPPPPTPHQRDRSAAPFTFLPTPDGDGVLRVHAHRHQQPSGCTEVDVIHPLGVEAPQHGEGVFGHGIPDVD